MEESVTRRTVSARMALHQEQSTGAQNSPTKTGKAPGSEEKTKKGGVNQFPVATVTPSLQP